MIPERNIKESERASIGQPTNQPTNTIMPPPSPQKTPQKHPHPTTNTPNSSLTLSMEDKETKKKKKNHHKSTDSPQFKASSDVKGIRFGGQFVVKSFTVRRASPLELLRLLSIPPSSPQHTAVPFPSTTTFIPTNFTILAHHAWHTLTLGLGTKKSKVIMFVFESEIMKSAVDRLWPPMAPLGDVNKKMIRGLTGCELARFKFRKGCLTFYVYAVRRTGATGFLLADDLRKILEAVVALKDFLDHTAMLALPSQRSITFQHPSPVTKF